MTSMLQNQWIVGVLSGMLSGVISGFAVSEWYRRVNKIRERTELLDILFAKLVPTVNDFSRYVRSNDIGIIRSSLENAFDIVLFRKLYRVVKRNDQRKIDEITALIIELKNKFNKPESLTDIQVIADEFGKVGQIAMSLHELR